MKINVAGYNIDKSLIDSLDKVKATPEVISAAYARISRSKKNVTSLRKDALAEVEKARKSNNNIIFEMGHSSIAEHVVFNLDILDVSRYLTEFIQKSRLASFTEKSQRYVTLTSAYYIPKELSAELRAEYIELMEYLFTSYEEMFQLAKAQLIKENFAGSSRELEGKAKEDARYILPLSTQTQMGVTINARSLERLLRRLDGCGIAEAVDLKKLIAEQVQDIAPSVIKYTEAEVYEKCKNKIPALSKVDNNFEWKLNHHTENPDLKILAYYIFENSGESLDNIEQYLASLSYPELKSMFNSIFADMKAYHLPIKAFEVADFEFQFDVSASCFAQLKRHRMATIIKSQYAIESGYVIPPQLMLLNQRERFEQAYAKISNLYAKLDCNIAPYILTNAHKVRVVMKANLRELYHFSRLRSDSHAQWEIQELSDVLITKIQEVAPLSASLMMGKDKFNETIKNLKA
jgi:flavin-dependent thymidylate synthase